MIFAILDINITWNKIVLPASVVLGIESTIFGLKYNWKKRIPWLAF